LRALSSVVISSVCDKLSPKSFGPTTPPSGVQLSLAAFVATFVATFVELFPDLASVPPPNHKSKIEN